MREIVFDTETTGLDPLKGDRVVEIGCVELINYVATGRTWHTYLNPERDMPAEAVRVHGLTEEFLADKPIFSQVVDQFLDFIGGDPLVAHNAAFDVNFMNAELKRTGFKMLTQDRVIDTVLMARKKYPGAPASLDALCKRFGVDMSSRKLHGALLDARLLAEVYLELRGGRQPDLNITSSRTDQVPVQNAVQQSERRAPRSHSATEDEIKAHEAFLAQLKDPLWKRLS